MKIGYARVSTEDQKLNTQIDALKEAGCKKIYSEKVTGSKRARPELEKMLEDVRVGDVVVITKYDRLSRNLRDLIDIVGQINGKDAGFKSLAEDIDTTTPAGRLVFHVFGSIAEFERARTIERVNEGLATARKHGRVGGRRPSLSKAQIAEVIKMRDEENRSPYQIAELFKVSHMTIRRAKLPTKKVRNRDNIYNQF